jgi:hypothetical protein
MAAIGVLPYLIVFNLNQIVKVGKTNYLSLKHGMVDKMQADEREKWSKKGELFHKHRPRRNAEEPKPTEWWILVYFLQKALDIVRLRRKKKPAGNASG